MMYGAKNSLSWPNAKRFLDDELDAIAIGLTYSSAEEMN